MGVPLESHSHHMELGANLRVGVRSAARFVDEGPSRLRGIRRMASHERVWNTAQTGPIVEIATLCEQLNRRCEPGTDCYPVEMRKTAVKEDLAREVWRHLFDFIRETAEQRDLVLERLHLTPGDSRTLASLDVDDGRTMRSLAEEWRCDPSNATWMVDRLVRRGLAERREAPRDRRVKLIVLTPRGAQTKADLLTGLYAPPPELLSLTRTELTSLRDTVKVLRPLPDAPLSSPAPRWHVPRDRDGASHDARPEAMPLDGKPGTVQSAN
jgi:DNA-binding MarR family transcriptional regulator